MSPIRRSGSRRRTGGGGPHPIVRLLGGNGRAALLLLLAVTIGAAAWWLFPTDGPVTTNYGLRDLQLTAASVPDEVKVYLIPDSQLAGMDVRIMMFAYNPGPGPVKATITVARSTRWGSAECDPAAVCTTTNQAKEVTYTLSGWTGLASPGRLHEAEATFKVPDIGDNESHNDEFVAAVLPNVQFYQAGYPTTLHDLRVALAVPGGSRYTWTASDLPTPFLDGSFTSWDFTNFPGAVVTANGVSLAAQNRDTKRTFIAGAALGVAGAALVGSIAEFRRPGTEEGTRERRRRLAEEPE
jgi:hypothetical protein